MAPPDAVLGHRGLGPGHGVLRVGPVRVGRGLAGRRPGCAAPRSGQHGGRSGRRDRPGRGHVDRVPGALPQADAALHHSDQRHAAVSDRRAGPRVLPQRPVHRGRDLPAGLRGQAGRGGGQRERCLQVHHQPARAPGRDARTHVVGVLTGGDQRAAAGRRGVGSGGRPDRATLLRDLRRPGVRGGRALRAPMLCSTECPPSPWTKP